MRVTIRVASLEGLAALEPEMRSIKMALRLREAILVVYHCPLMASEDISILGNHARLR